MYWIPPLLLRKKKKTELLWSDAETKTKKKKESLFCNPLKSLNDSINKKKKAGGHGELSTVQQLFWMIPNTKHHLTKYFIWNCSINTLKNLTTSRTHYQPYQILFYKQTSTSTQHSSATVLSSLISRKQQRKKLLLFKTHKITDLSYIQFSYNFHPNDCAA